ncbi:MAG TPA: protein-glutamate O-methyltransferase CheR [Candidatus Marinimicrobia bacterium]|nr:protein-glutamate O-methyltransferase CheR [Candidatus Neomarinimicrobiota bacterium]
MFDEIRKIVYEVSGINLIEGKEALVSARISKRMRALSIPDFRSYLKYLKSDESGLEMISLIDVISTNVTSFFREQQHFVFLKEIVQSWLNDGQRSFRLWSAASSTGEEPYTIAITMLETLTGVKADVKILATDISTNVLARCEKGTYSEEKVKPVPHMIRDRYFELERLDNEKFFTVKPMIKKMLTFRRLNLSQVPYPMKGPFDVVFCRNVMIYFDNTIRKQLLDEIYRLLRPDGILIVGHSESLTGLNTSFKALKPSIYVKIGM